MRQLSPEAETANCRRDGGCLQTCWSRSVAPGPLPADRLGGARKVVVFPAQVADEYDQGHNQTAHDRGNLHEGELPAIPPGQERGIEQIRSVLTTLLLRLVDSLQEVLDVVR